MRLNEEMINAIHCRSKDIQKKSVQRKIRAYQVSALIVCFLLATGLAFLVPLLNNRKAASTNTTDYNSQTPGVTAPISENEKSPDLPYPSSLNAPKNNDAFIEQMISYLIPVIVAFFLGICATLFCLYIQKRLTTKAGKLD